MTHFRSRVLRLASSIALIAASTSLGSGCGSGSGTDFSTAEVAATCRAWCDNSENGALCYRDGNASRCYDTCVVGCPAERGLSCDFPGSCIQPSTALRACELSLACSGDERDCQNEQNDFDACGAKNTIGITFCASAARCEPTDEETCLARFDDDCWFEWLRFVGCRNPGRERTCEDCEFFFEEWQECLD